MFTREQVPYKEPTAIWLRPVGLHHDLDVWRSTETGWVLSLSGWPLREGQEQGITMAARRKDATKEITGGESEESNWYLTQRFGVDQAPLAVLYSMTSLLSIYSDHLSDLRDHIGVKRLLHGPVRQARELDKYLIGDGLDAATITAEIHLLTKDPTRLSFHLPRYTEDLEGKKRQPRELVPFLYDWLSKQATRLAEDSATTTGNIRASAELRQAIANTKLQRILFVVSVIAAVAAVIALFIQPH